MGQFGSLYDPMKWSARNQTFNAAVNYEVNPKWSLYANFAWNNGRGSITGVSLDPSQAAGIPPGYNYAAMSEIGRFSALNGAFRQEVLGTNYQLKPEWALHLAYYGGKFDDRSPYLMDTTGRTRGVEGGISYVF